MRKTASFFEFSLCLSRACLGKIIGFIYKWRKTPFFAGKPTVLILSNGGAVAIDGLIDGPRAIVEAFSPAQQTPALASLLFGEENRWGRLPYTICKHAIHTFWPQIR